MAKDNSIHYIYIVYTIVYIIVYFNTVQYLAVQYIMYNEIIDTKINVSALIK